MSAFNSRKNPYGVRAFIDRMFELLYPSNVACNLCGEETLLDEENLCESCRADLTPCPPMAAPEPLDGIRCAFVFQGGAALGIHALKYMKQTRLASFFAERMDAPSEWSFDAVVPVPLHPFKRWLRTYNQSELIARAYSERTGSPLLPKLLRRTRFTETQTHLSAAARERNVANAFSASPAAAGRAVLLIDDVTTTHSTLVACAQALKRAGAKRVYALCACSAEKAVTKSNA